MTNAPPVLSFVQISDIHLCVDGPLLGAVDTGERLRAALDAIIVSGVRPAALLLTGDLVEDGVPEGYRLLRALVDPVAEQLGAEVVALPGNHDDRDALRRELLDGGAIDRVLRFGETRLITLDTSDPGLHPGRCEADQLAWLADALADEDGGAILALHHTPLPSYSPYIAGIGFRDPQALAAVLAGSDVRLVVGGHTHQAATGSLGGVPVWNGPALSYSADPLAPQGRIRTWLDGGISRIDVFDGWPVATLVPVPLVPRPLFDRPLSELVERMDAARYAEGHR